MTTAYAVKGLGIDNKTCKYVTSSINIMIRDQPNSGEKMHDFTAEFLKCVKFTGHMHRRYFEVLC